MGRLAIAVLMNVFFVVGTLLAAEMPTGTWKTVDEKSGKVVSQVEVCEEGGKIFGKITGLTEPNERIGNINALQRRAPHSWPPSP